MDNKITPAVIIKSKFILPFAAKHKFKDYLSYMNRLNTHSHENGFEKYQDYMRNEEKSTGLFTNDKDFLNEEELENLKEVFKQSQEKGSILWQDVISFNNEWLKETGIYKENFIDEKKLQQVTRKAVNQMLKKEGIENSAIWSAAIHYNTDNIHIHVSTIQTKNFRVRGKRKQQSLDAMKSSVSNSILDRRKENEKLNDFIRNQVIASKRNDDLTSIKNHLVNYEMVKQFKLIHKMLPEDKRLWRYNMNGIANERPEIDKLTNMYIQKHFKKEFEVFKKQLDKEVEFYRKTYGEDSRAEKYRETKMKDLYTRMGNTILKEIKEYDYKIKSDSIKNKIQKIKRDREISNFMFRMNREMNDNLQHYKNQRAFEQFEREQEFGKE
jgi:MobL relaxases